MVLGRRMAGKAGLVQRFAIRLAVGESRETPAAGRNVFFESFTMNCTFDGLPATNDSERSF